MARLYLVPTPIGNLEDITLRAIRILKESDFVLAEDTRTSGFLLKHYEISTQLVAYHQHNEHKALQGIIARINQCRSVALISDAGTPGISDAGFLLIRECIRSGITVECLPGPTALIPALICSGLPSERFIFEGFLPHKKGRQTKIADICRQDCTIILYESPHRLVKTLEQLSAQCGPERVAVVCRELSKIYEEIRRGTLAQLHSHYSEHAPKGEIVLLISGNK